MRNKNPERRLLAAVLLRAIDDLEVTSVDAFKRPMEEIRKKTLKWFADERKDPMSFIFICEYLDIDAKALRRKIARGFKNKCMRDTKQIMGGRVGTYNRKKEKQENDK